MLMQSRLNKRPVKKKLPSTANFAATQAQTTWTRYVQTSRTVRFLATRSAEHVSLEKRMNQTIAASPQTSKASAATVDPALPMQQTRAVLGQT